MLSLAMLDTLHPLACVALSPVVPVHSAPTVTPIAVPLPLIHIAGSVASEHVKSSHNNDDISGQS